MRNVVVTGGRWFNETRFIHSKLDELHKIDPIVFMIQGNAQGVDKICGAWALKNEINTLVMPAKWKRDGNVAGPIRNREMANWNMDLNLISFPGGTGTRDMIKYCTEEKKMNHISIEIHEMPEASLIPKRYFKSQKISDIIKVLQSMENDHKVKKSILQNYKWLEYFMWKG